MPKIPTEDDFKAALEADGEKLRQMTGQDHGPFNDLPDMMDDALENNRRNGLAAKAPTRGTSWLSDRAWVDDQKIVLSMMVFECHVDEWEEQNDRYLHILHEKGPAWSALYNEIACDAVGSARENARSLRFL